MSTSIPGASVWEQRLYDHFAGHVAAERDVLTEYRQLAEDESAAPSVRYVARLILDDEIRHHQTFQDLAEAIRQMGELRTEDEPIPSLRGLRADADRVVAAADRLIAVEKEDARELKELAKELADVQETTLFGLLVDVMRRDTDKHLAILKFLRARAKEAARS
jgi:rubrerythrin